ncbi:MAG: saccharopine dehydrogenase family protein [Dehalococcoidia bacterium]
MRVLVLGASGGVGRGVTRLLAKSDLVTELVLAGRRLEAAEAVAAEVGEKARAAQVDIHDAARLRSLSAACDIVVHAAGPHYETLLPALRAAIEVGVHFTDFSDGGRSLRQALTLDADAKAAGITAIVGLGWSPGMTNLLAKHAYAQLDAVDELQIVWLANKSLVKWRQSWHGAIMPSLLDSASGAVPTFRDGEWVDIVAPASGVDVVFPGGGTARAYPSGFPEPVTLPRYLPGLRTVSALAAHLPERVSDLYQEQVRRLSAGECTAEQASNAFYAALEAEPEPLPEDPPEFPGPTAFVRARGHKNGRAVCLTCTSTLRDGGSGNFALASLQILRGEISQRGVMPPEACLDPLPFLAQVVEMLPESERPADGQLIVESYE